MRAADCGMLGSEGLEALEAWLSSLKNLSTRFVLEWLGGWTRPFELQPVCLQWLISGYLCTIRLFRAAADMINAACG